MKKAEKTDEMLDFLLKNTIYFITKQKEKRRKIYKLNTIKTLQFP